MEAFDLFINLIWENPQDRFTAKQALDDPFFKKEVKLLKWVEVKSQQSSQNSKDKLSNVLESGSERSSSPVIISSFGN